METTSEQEKLRRLLEHGQLEPFIKHIRYPQYKNIAPGTKVEFSFPITALVGANGTNKSSVLRSLYGAPGHNNLGNLWFSTSTDPIKETGGNASCFIYGYKNAAANRDVEVLKTRINKESDPDYWEPSRPIVGYGMERMPKLLSGTKSAPGRSKTRWNTIDKNVVYLDFRSALSAFDKFFYHGELRARPNNERNRKAFIRYRSPRIKAAADDGASSYKFFGKERIVDGENRLLTPIELNAVSTILGREYSEIRLIRHTFFNTDAYTCLIKTAGLRYTEAFAGSGEFAVIRIVVGVIGAAKNSLILLDEPEVSLHPGAQERLVKFLYKEVSTSKHQVVISTHSPAIVRCLPPEAIKVFVFDPVSELVNLPSQKALPEEAFIQLGEPIPGRIMIIVEDVLAKAIVERALQSVGKVADSIFDIQFFPGGSKTQWGHYLPIYAAENRKNIIVLFDADQKTGVEFIDPDTIGPADDQKIVDNLRAVTGVNISFHVDGGANGPVETQLNDMRRSFVKWARKHVRYLPGDGCPESFIWDRMKPDAQSSRFDGLPPKKRFESLAREELGVPDHQQISSLDIAATQRRKLASLPLDHGDLVSIKNELMQFAESLKLNAGQ